jgi:hypothetical protein
MSAECADRRLVAPDPAAVKRLLAARLAKPAASQVGLFEKRVVF